MKKLNKDRILKTLNGRVKNFPLRFDSSIDSPHKINVSEIRRIALDVANQLVNNPFQFAYATTGNVLVAGFKFGPNEEGEYRYEIMITQDFKSISISSNDEKNRLQNEIKVENDAAAFFGVK